LVPAVYLQPIGCAVVIADVARAENFVAVGDNGFKQNFWHGAVIVEQVNPLRHLS